MHACFVPVYIGNSWDRDTLIWHACTHVRKVACIVLFMPNATRAGLNSLHSVRPAAW